MVNKYIIVQLDNLNNTLLMNLFYDDYLVFQ